MNPDQNKYTFKFLSYYFNKDDLTATFCYQGIDNVIFTENIVFDKNPDGIAVKDVHPSNIPVASSRYWASGNAYAGTSSRLVHP